MIQEKYSIEFEQGTSALHRFTKDGNDKVIFLMHGYFEDGKIFYSKSGKGFAPFLVANGYDVFVCDLLGKGESTPKVTNGFYHSQFEIITRDIPTYLNKVRAITGKQKISLGGHSWGGVVLLAYMARFKDKNILSIATFGSKRRIARKNLRKLIQINLGWTWYGNRLVEKHGYLPAKNMKMGNTNEPKAYYQQADIWVREKEWIDPEDNFNYNENFNFEMPPLLFITGKGDKILGHPKDVKLLADETDAKKVVYRVIGKKTGHMHNYDHINLLTHKDAPNDHFKFVLEFLEKFN